MLVFVCYVITGIILDFSEGEASAMKEIQKSGLCRDYRERNNVLNKDPRPLFRTFFTNPLAVGSCQ